jgi:putative membrane protein
MVLGIVLLVALLRQAGVDQIHDRMDALGPWSPLVLVPWLVIAVCDALGWRCTLPPVAAARVPIVSLTLIRMAGEAVNSVTPTVAVGGEPVKAHLLRAWGVSRSDSLASIVIAKTALTLSQSLFVVLGIAALCERWDQGARGVLWVGLLLLATVGFAFALVHLQRQGPASTVWRWIRRMAPRARLGVRLEEGAYALDARLEAFYRIERRALWRASAWHLLGWLLGVTEVMLIMYLIGAPVPWQEALIIEALSQPIRAAAIVIPGGLGTQEIGGVALCTLLGMPAPEAATLWLLKRGRELVFDGAGLVYLAHRSAARRRSRSA